MHVLQLLPRLDVGGVERGVLDLAKGLLRRGHRVSVISAGGPLVEPLERLGAAHYQLPVDEKSLLTMRACIPAVARFIRDQQIDLVHARSRVPGWIGYAAARWTQRPFVATAHGFYSPHVGSRVMVWGRFVIVPSDALGRYLVERRTASLYRPLGRAWFALPIPMAVFPALAFLSAAGWLGSVYVGAATLVLAAGHLPNSWAAWRSVEKSVPTA